MNTFSKAALILIAFIFISCDKDFNTLGSDIIGDEHFEFKLYDEASLDAYTKPTGPVQTNNLPLNVLGIYKNPVFGTTKAHLVTQIEMIGSNPTVGFNPYIDQNKDSVYVYIPFFKPQAVGETDDEKTFYGNDNQPKFDLKIYQNGYNLREFDPTDQNKVQKYYSDDKGLIDPHKGSIVLNDSDNTSQNSAFFFNNEDITIYKTNGNGEHLNASGAVTFNPDEYVVKETKASGMWIKLGTKTAARNFFETEILDAVEDGHLYNNNTFKQHFKGLYFEVSELIPDQGALAKLDLSKAEMVLQYHYFKDALETDPTKALKSSLKFQMGYSGSKKSISVNFLELTDINANYSNALTPAASHEKLFLKGGATGSVVFIDVFNDTELQTLRNYNWLINEASLVFHIDQTTMSNTSYEPFRIYLYDATNNKPLIDYYADPSKGSSANYDKFIHGGIIEKNSSGKGTQYKIRITEYINNVLNGTNPNNNKNVRLGLVVTENINTVTNASLKNPFTINSDEIKNIPVSSVINPIGTVLYGTQSTDPDKKLKLEIYYTKPN